MDKATEMGKNSAKGSFQLFLGKTLSTLIMAVGAIILGILLVDNDYGLYAVALIPAATIVLFQDWGVNSAMTKFCVQGRTANKNDAELRQIVISGLVFELATGVMLTLLSFFAANFIATVIINKPESAPLISLVSLSILFGSFSSAAQSVFVGFERMKPISYIAICQAVAFCVLPPLLVYEHLGAYGAVLGYVLSTMVACLVSASFLYILILKNFRNNPNSRLSMSKSLKKMLNYGVPLATANILGAILAQFYSFMMANLVTDSMIGNYKVATNFAVFLAFFTVPILTVMFPAFSKIDPDHEKSLLEKVFQRSIKYASLLLVPATMAIAVLSGPITNTLYGDKWPFAPSFLVLSVIGTLLVVLGAYSVTSLLSAFGETKLLMKLNLLELMIGIPIGFLLIPWFGITGLIVAGLAAGLPSFFTSLYWVWKRYGLKVDYKSSGKILLAAFLATAVTFAFQSILVTAAWVALVMDAAIFLLVYLISMPIFGAINNQDIDNLRSILSGLGIFSEIVDMPLALMEKLLKNLDWRRQKDVLDNQVFAEKR